MMEAADLKLKERVKELKCLYDLSKIALEAGNDLSTILSKTLTILPQAMQYPELAEVSITVNRTSYVTKGFGKSRHHITSSIGIGKKKNGLIKIGYRPSRNLKARSTFLIEEKNLLRIVARELSLFIKR